MISVLATLNGYSAHTHKSLGEESVFHVDTKKRLLRT